MITKKQQQKTFRIFFSRAPGSISIRFGINHPWVKGIQVCSNEEPLNSYEVNNGFFSSLNQFLDFDCGCRISIEAPSLSLCYILNLVSFRKLLNICIYIIETLFKKKKPLLVQIFSNPEIFWMNKGLFSNFGRIQDCLSYLF